tara:strand:- start:942 stop:1229 length:288 start_codon:yes stop_codon:yes gene_type:complete
LYLVYKKININNNMFTFYSSVSRLLPWNKADMVISKNPSTPVEHTVTEIKNHIDTMLSPNSSRDVFMARNDANETIIVEYSKHDKTFNHYRPKFF